MTDYVTLAIELTSVAIIILGAFSHNKSAKRIEATLVKAAPDIPKVVQAAEQVAQDVSSA